jgi:predicted outer membrane lipoprotein
LRLANAFGVSELRLANAFGVSELRLANAFGVTSELGYEDPLR